jgi:transcriptional regulator with XRE-family HTH domain
MYYIPVKGYKMEGVLRILDGRQLTAARALAGMTVLELAAAAEVTPRTIHRLEISGAVPIASKRRHGHVSKATFGKIASALAQCGVELLDESRGHGSGVRWVLPRDERGHRRG